MGLSRVPFYFIRHGETDWNREERAQGQVDIPLNARGLTQAEDAARALEGITIASIASSPLSRALETARAVERTTGTPIHILDDLRECAWGEWEGTIKGPWYSGWKTGELTPKGGEYYPDFAARALNGFNAALALPGPVLIVSHGGVFGTLRPECGIEPSYAAPNATPLKLMPPSVPAGRGWSLVELPVQTTPGAEPIHATLW